MAESLPRSLVLRFRDAVLLVLWGVALAALAPCSAQAATVFDLTPSQDARMVSLTPTTPQGSADMLSVYTSIAQNNYQRTLLQFDLSTLPVGRSVVAAQLVLFTKQIGWYRNTTGQPMEVYRMTRGWVEASVTWSQASSTPGDTWNGADGYFVGTNGAPGTNPYASSSAQPTANGVPVTWDVTSLVSAWYGGVTNHGLLIRSYDGNQLVFHSREATDPALRPVLHVTLDTVLVPEAPSVALAVLGVLLPMALRLLTAHRA